MGDVLVTCFGTATEVGKTFVGAAVLTELRRSGRSVSARKPAQSFDPEDGQPTDAEVLAAATGEDPHDVCPAEGWLPVPMAPPMAAVALGQDGPTLDQLLDRLRWPDVDVRWLETVGGPRSPYAVDGDGIDLALAAGTDACVLVADAGLGTINAVRLCVEAITHAGLPAPLVHLNRYDEAADLHRRNRAWLGEVSISIGDLAGRLATVPRR
jgi:dethiobiotin synthetase